jgi:osmotically-inducible protein OsmY
MNRDDRLRQMVIDELEWEPRSDAAHIGVACRDGVVTLSGHVASYAERMSAERAARRVRDVKALAIELDVRLPSDRKTADDEIAARAVKILQWDSIVPDERISIEVEKGIVTLAGTVEWQYQKDEAEFDIHKLGGVKMIINDIVVKPQIRAADVKDGIRRALERNADLDASRITVTVQNDKVILDGKVGAWIEREIAERAAWSAPGVAAVEDRIAIARP